MDSRTRAAACGTLTAADPRGRVLAEAHTAPGTPFTTVVADVPAGTGPTLYTRLGDWFAWLCLALVAAALLTARPRRRVPDGLTAPPAAPAVHAPRR